MHGHTYIKYCNKIYPLKKIRWTLSYRPRHNEKRLPYLRSGGMYMIDCDIFKNVVEILFS